jgi:hypothetical protein
MAVYDLTAHPSTSAGKEWLEQLGRERMQPTDGSWSPTSAFAKSGDPNTLARTNTTIDFLKDYQQRDHWSGFFQHNR